MYSYKIKREVIVINIKTYRKNKKIKQIELARKVNISINSLQNYENNKRKPDVYTAIALAEVLETKTFKEFKDLFEIPQRQLRENKPLKK